MSASIPDDPQELRNSWRRSGIPVAYSDPVRGLNYHIQEGTSKAIPAAALIRWFQNPESYHQTLAGKGLVFVDADDELFALTARSVALQFHLPVYYGDLFLVSHPRPQGGIFSRVAAGELKALFLCGFYNPHYPKLPFSPEDAYHLEANLRWLLKQGVALFLQTEDSLARQTWWPASLINKINQHCDPAPYV